MVYNVDVTPERNKDEFAVPLEALRLGQVPRPVPHTAPSPAAATRAHRRQGRGRADSGSSGVGGREQGERGACVGFGGLGLRSVGTDRSVERQPRVTTERGDRARWLNSFLTRIRFKDRE